MAAATPQPSRSCTGSPSRHRAWCDDVAEACLRAYRSLPPNGAKPTRRSNHRLEWTILAGLVLTVPDAASGLDLPLGEPPRHCLPVSIATGLKCLSYDRLPPTGDVLHDTHAEILARRGARRWLLAKLLDEHRRRRSIPPQPQPGGRDDPFATIFEPSPTSSRWRLRQGVRLHWYVSAMPCGDASTVLLDFQRAKQDEAHASGGATTPTSTPTTVQLLDLYDNPSTDASEAAHRSAGAASTPHGLSRGRAGLDRTDALRTKPGRPDSPPSISMSCSDKLALWTELGLQGSLASVLLEPIRAHSIVMGDEALRQIFAPDTPEFQRLQRLLASRCRRALEGRLRRSSSDAALAQSRDRNALHVYWTSMAFDDSRESAERQARAEMETSASNPWSDHEPIPCAGSILWSPGIPSHPSAGAGGSGSGDTVPALHENLVGGIKMGAPAKRKSPTEALRPSSRSKVCKLDFYTTTAAIVRHLHGDLELPPHLTYYDAKHAALDGVAGYREAKARLVGRRSHPKPDAHLHAAIEAFLADRSTAIRHRGEADEDDPSGPSQALQPPEMTLEDAPFQGWLVTPSRFEAFDQTSRLSDDAPASAR
ncbi:hypothetical protein ACQY0O_008054 [Thecaphora frezii]